MLAIRKQCLWTVVCVLLLWCQVSRGFLPSSLTRYSSRLQTTALTRIKSVVYPHQLVSIRCRFDINLLSATREIEVSSDDVAVDEDDEDEVEDLLTGDLGTTEEDNVEDEEDATPLQSIITSTSEDDLGPIIIHGENYSFYEVLTKLRREKKAMSSEQAKEYINSLVNHLMVNSGNNTNKMYGSIVKAAMAWKQPDIVLNVTLHCLSDPHFLPIIAIRQVSDSTLFVSDTTNVEKALQIIDAMLDRNIRVKRSLFLKLLLSSHNATDVLAIFRRIKLSSIDIDVVIFNHALRAIEPNEWKSTLKLLDLMALFGLKPNQRSYTNAIYTLSNANQIDLALRLWNEMKMADLTLTDDCYKLLSIAFARNQRWKDLDQLLQEKRLNAATALSEFTFTSILDSMKNMVETKPPVETKPSAKSQLDYNTVSNNKHIIEYLRTKDIDLQVEKPHKKAIELIRKYGGHVFRINSDSVFISAMDIAEKYGDYQSFFELNDDYHRLLNHAVPSGKMLSRLMKAAAELKNSTAAIHILRTARSNGLDSPLLYQTALELCYESNNFEDALEMISFKCRQSPSQQMYAWTQPFGLDVVVSFISLGLKEIVKNYDGFIASVDMQETQSQSSAGNLLPTSTATVTAVNAKNSGPSLNIRQPAQLLGHLVNLVRYLLASDISYASSMLQIIQHVNYLLVDCGEYELVRKILAFYLKSSKVATSTSIAKTGKKSSMISSPAIKASSSSGSSGSSKVDKSQLSQLYEGVSQHLLKQLQTDILNVRKLNPAAGTGGGNFMSSKLLTQNASLLIDVLTDWMEDLMDLDEVDIADRIFRKGIAALTGPLKALGNKERFVKEINDNLPSHMGENKRRLEILKRYQEQQKTAQRNGKLLRQFIKRCHDFLFERNVFDMKVYNIVVNVLYPVQAIEEILEFYQMALDDLKTLKRKGRSVLQSVGTRNPNNVDAVFFKLVVKASAQSPIHWSRALELLKKELNFVPRFSSTTKNKLRVDEDYDLFELAIEACKIGKDSKQALEFYNRLLQYGYGPNLSTMKLLLQVLMQNRHPYQEVSDVVMKMNDYALVADDEIYGMLIQYAVTCNRLDDAMSMFLEMSKLSMPNDVVEETDVESNEEPEQSNEASAGPNTKASNRRTSKRKAKKEESKNLKVKNVEELGPSILFEERSVDVIEKYHEYESLFTPRVAETRNMYIQLIEGLYKDQRFEDMDFVYLQALSKEVFNPFNALLYGAVDVIDHSMPLTIACLRLVRKAALNTFSASRHCSRDFNEKLSKLFADFRAILPLKREYRLKSNIKGFEDESLYIRFSNSMTSFENLMTIVSTTLNVPQQELIGEFSDEDTTLSMPRPRLMK